MDMTDTCGCKGIRTCIICEKQGKPTISLKQIKAVKLYNYCCRCKRAWCSSGLLEDDIHHTETSYNKNDGAEAASQNEDETVCQHSGQSIEFSGIVIIPDFVSAQEEKEICDKIDQTPFSLSQSGRRKQDYGPKVNFKKKKLKMSNFTGLPEFSREIYERMKKVERLSDFLPVELCNLEYTAERGSSIDPHFDDFWLWGERLVTLNLLSDSVLCFTNEDRPELEVHVPMFRRCLLIVYGPARHVWKHAIHRQDIQDRRIAITFRELSKEFQSNGLREEEGNELLKIALTFNGLAVGV